MKMRVHAIMMSSCAVMAPKQYLCIAFMYIKYSHFHNDCLFFLDKKISSSNSGAKTHRYLFSAFGIYIVFFYAKKGQSL
jgi:hypothetical protein